MTQSDTYDLARFVSAQGGGVYEAAFDEIRQGCKQGHWMWFIFPQIAGLGFSPIAERYALNTLDEARVYLGHPILGSRLKACAAAVAGLKGRTAHEVFGSPDDLKLRSSLTLFEAADPAESVFGQALDALCGGVRDAQTLKGL